jgi:hypothetical protein
MRQLRPKLPQKTATNERIFNAHITMLAFKGKYSMAKRYDCLLDAEAAHALAAAPADRN